MTQRVHLGSNLSAKKPNGLASGRRQSQAAAASASTRNEEWIHHPTRWEAQNTVLLRPVDFLLA